MYYKNTICFIRQKGGMKQKECMEELLNQQRNEQTSSLELSLVV